ncbi:hypothetical protein EVAR_41969_1 [Eumeta japonica]|uniref:Uncharacterized protein n=1 Tax=Eumeta variegata TaxID=151549 RepID=A0A4C1WQK0_EUMVA|nr:hypothetical protein EVAR_41969_1 [Eumeta japonica]
MLPLRLSGAVFLWSGGNFKLDSGTKMRHSRWSVFAETTKRHLAEESTSEHTGLESLVVSKYITQTIPYRNIAVRLITLFYFFQQDIFLRTCPNAGTLSRHESPDCWAKRGITQAQ